MIDHPGDEIIMVAFILPLCCFPGCPALDLVCREVKKADLVSSQEEARRFIEAVSQKGINNKEDSAGCQGTARELMDRFPYSPIMEAGASVGPRTRMNQEKWSEATRTII